MFQKLRIRLTLFNLLVITVLLLLITLAAFVGSPTNATDGVNPYMLQVALTGELPPHRVGHYRNQQGGLIRLQIGADGTVAAVLSELTLKGENYQSLAEQIMNTPGSGGEIHIDGLGTYLYLRVILESGGDTVIVLQEVISTFESFLAFASRIGPTLIFALALIFFASLFITQRALRPIRKAWDRQIEFTADASHELRTPLSAIQLNLEAATDDPAETIEDNKQWFDNIKAEIARMVKLVNDLLTLSRSDSGVQTVVKQYFSLDAALNKVVEVIQPYAKSKNIQLESDIEAGLVMNGDQELICRLAVILLDNAIKYTPAAGKVQIAAHANGRQLFIKVTDTGIGIGVEHIEQIFNRFYRVEKSRSGDVDGSGLGLSLAKWIVTAHGGTISVSSEVTKGSEFTFLLARE